MTQSELWKRWQVTKAHLRFATQLLPDLPTQNDGDDPAKDIETLDAYNEYLEHNELELALDQLEGLGELNTVPPAYWRNLANAAEIMDLHERATQLMDQFRLALAIPADEQADATEQSGEPEPPITWVLKSQIFDDPVTSCVRRFNGYMGRQSGSSDH